MVQPVGVLAVRIWRDESGQLRSRVMAKLDLSDERESEVSYFSSVENITTTVISWWQRYAALTDSGSAGSDPSETHRASTRSNGMRS
jgi:hypothetical protein